MVPVQLLRKFWPDLSLTILPTSGSRRDLHRRGLQMHTMARAYFGATQGAFPAQPSLSRGPNIATCRNYLRAVLRGDPSNNGKMEIFCRINCSIQSTTIRHTFAL